MEITAEQRVAEAINEKGKWLKVGWIPFYVRPMTYGQIADLSAEVSQLSSLDSDVDGGSMLSIAMKRGKDFAQLVNVAGVAMFRNKWLRRFFSGYLRRHLATKHYKKLQELIFTSVDPAFFLQTIIFLKGMNKMEPTKQN